MQRSDLLLGLYILVPVIFLIIPIPTLLLDFLILLNISLALIILFTALFSKEALQMSAFPTILLMTTLFRLSLNVGSTRNILLNGYAGNVVATFGDFVGGGNLIVGVIIFVVLILIQMIVINKGSERVSEVTARFTLDAMPGKQMAIDADLNTGAITDEQAKERRQKIQDEAAFFGSMDGATKYVKGDATAGLIITAINFVGGLVLGIMMQGLSMDEALQKYTILTIGDGLVSQIPVTDHLIVNRYPCHKGFQGIGSWRCTDAAIVFNSQGTLYRGWHDGISWHCDAVTDMDLSCLCRDVYCSWTSYGIFDGGAGDRGGGYCRGGDGGGDQASGECRFPAAG